jgi:hypothetical protein
MRIAEWGIKYMIIDTLAGLCPFNQPINPSIRRWRIKPYPIKLYGIPRTKPSFPLADHPNRLFPSIHIELQMTRIDLWIQTHPHKLWLSDPIPTLLLHQYLYSSAASQKLLGLRIGNKVPLRSGPTALEERPCGT